MKLKYFYLGLLSTLVIASQAEAMQYRAQQAPQMEQKLREHEQVEAVITPKLDVVKHGDVEHAAQKIEDKLGAHAHPSGGTINHSVKDLRDHLGVKTIDGGASGATAHHKLADLKTIQGAVTNDISPQGANSGHGGGNVDDLAITAIANEEAILARLKSAILANIAVPLIGRTNTKTANTGAGPITLGNANNTQDTWNAMQATNIQDFLAELGW